MSRALSSASAITTTTSIEDHQDNISVTSDEDCRSDSEDEGRLTPDTPDSDHTREQIMAASGRCAFQEGCKLPSPDRKVTSHYFGRNKKETRGIPEHCWVLYCRQHYQRTRYRSSATTFALSQLELVRKTVENLQKWGGVQDWTIALRKRVVDKLNAEDQLNKEILDAKNNGTQAPEPVPKEKQCRERWLVRFCGNNRSFDHVYEVLDAISHYCNATQCGALEFEIIPNFEGQSVKKPSVKRTAGTKPGASSRVTKPQRASTKAISPRQINRAKS